MNAEGRCIIPSLRVDFVRFDHPCIEPTCVDLWFSSSLPCQSPWLLVSCLIWWVYMCISQQIIGFPHASVAVTACLTAHEIMVESLVSDWLTSFSMHRMCARLCNKHHKEERIHMLSNETKTFSTYCSLELLSMCDVLCCFMKVR